MQHIYNFSPGPAKLDPSVISKSQDAVANYQNTGLSILERDFNLIKPWLSQCI